MEVILTQDIKGLGNAHEVVRVRDGYARNFLLPRKLVVLATEKNLRQIEETKRKKTAQLEKEKKQANELAQKLNGVSVNVAMSTNEEDKLYGSVANAEIAQALAEEGFQIEKSNIFLDEPIRNLGIYDVTIRLHPEVQTKIKVWIVKK